MRTEDAARVLAPPGRLSRLEKESLWSQIDRARRPWWRRRTAQLSFAGAALAAAATLVVLRPFAASTPAADHFTARGAASTPLALRCSPTREPGDCQPGDHLAFDFGPAAPAAYVALFARAADGTVIWYAPADDTSATAPFADHATHNVLDSAAVIDASYLAGRYELFAILADHPLTRGDIRAFEQDDHLAPPPGVRIETRVFTVGGAP